MILANAPRVLEFETDYNQSFSSLLFLEPVTEFEQQQFLLIRKIFFFKKLLITGQIE